MGEQVSLGAVLGELATGVALEALVLGSRGQYRSTVHNNWPALLEPWWRMVWSHGALHRRGPLGDELRPVVALKALIVFGQANVILVHWHERRTTKACQPRKHQEHSHHRCCESGSPPVFGRIISWVSRVVHPHHSLSVGQAAANSRSLVGWDSRRPLESTPLWKTMWSVEPPVALPNSGLPTKYSGFSMH